MVSPHVTIAPGRLISCNNFETISDRAGYSRPGGYERCTDDVLPSTTNWYALKIETVTGTITEGDVFTSGAFEVEALETVTTPADDTVMVFASQDASFSVPAIFIKTGNAFTVSEVISDSSSYTTEEIQTFNSAAIEATRTRVIPVPGTEILGGIRLRGKNYIFSSGKLYKGGNFAWTEITMPDIIYFNEGTVEFTVGDTLSDGTATGVITSITTQSGAYDAGLAIADQAEGYMTLTSVAGAFTVGGTLSDDHAGAAKVDVGNVTYVLPTTGRYDYRLYNFTNLANNESAYGVSGTAEAFEFDGTNYIPILVPDTTKFPNHVNIHQGRLQLSFQGGELLYSVSQLPRVFNALLGAGTYSTGDEIIGLYTIHGNAEAIFCKSSKWLLTGDGIYSDTSATRNWQFYEHDKNLGADEWSIAGKDFPVFINSAEAYLFISTNTSGYYGSISGSKDVQPLLADNKGLVVCSCWNIEKSQYRVFYSSGVGVYISTVGNNVTGVTKHVLPEPPKIVWTAMEDGEEYTFFVSDSMYLYRMDSGNSFDEEYITGSLRLPFYHYGDPRREKLFQQLILELDAPVFISNNTEITYTINLDYGSAGVPLPIAETADDVGGGGGLYGNNDGYGGFVWGSSIVAEIFAYLDGYGSNMSILITYKTKNDSAFTFLTAIVDFIKLGVKGRDI